MVALGGLHMPGFLSAMAPSTSPLKSKRHIRPSPHQSTTFDPTGKTMDANVRGTFDSELSNLSLSHHQWRSRDLILEFASFAPHSSFTPLLFPTCSVEGSVSITSPSSPSLFKEIRVTVKGIIKETSAGRSLSKSGNDWTGSYARFWSVSQVLYTAPESTTDDTLHPDPPTSFPFDIRIPESIVPQSGTSLDFGGAQQDLPPSFLEPKAPVAIQYLITVDVKRKGWMKTSTTLSAPFDLIPVARLYKPFSPSIIEAYRLQTSLPSPLNDIEPYSMFRSSFEITAFGRERIGVDCRVFLPKPLEYSTGRNIHFFMDFVPSSKPKSHRVSSASNPHSNSNLEFESESSSSLIDQAFSLLHHTNSTTITLQRRMDVRYLYANAGMPDVPLAVAQTWRYRDENSNAELEAGLGGAEGGQQQPQQQQQQLLQQGELAVPPGIMASFRFPYVKAEYFLSIQLSAPCITLHRSSPTKTTSPGVDPASGTLLTIPISILNASMIGDPDPPSYAPCVSYASSVASGSGSGSGSN